MKINLSPELAYFAGLWKARAIREGVGIEGDLEAQQIFLAEAISTLGIPPDKIQLKGRKAYFYHSAYRKFFEELVDNELETFRWQNKYSSNFLAGFFDGCGGVDEKVGAIYFARASEADQQLLERLGFLTKRMGRALYINAKSVREFAAFVFDSTKRTELKSRLSALMRSGNERDPR